MTAIVILSIVSMMLSISANADLDLSVGGVFRSYPLSGVVEVESGYGVPIWGAPMTPFSGYIRPRLVANSAVSYNAVDAGLEVFPIAFLGARAGGEAIQNDVRYSAYDCKRHQCLGRSYRTYFEVELSLGVGAFFAQGRWRRDRWTQLHPETGGDFVDPTSGFLMAAGGDSQTVCLGIAGVNLNPAWTILGVVRYAQTDPRQISRMPVGMVRYKSGGLTLGIGAGVFHSPLKEQEFTAHGILRWEIAPSLAVR